MALKTKAAYVHGAAPADLAQNAGADIPASAGLGDGEHGAADGRPGTRARERARQHLPPTLANRLISRFVILAVNLVHRNKRLTGGGIGMTGRREGGSPRYARAHPA